jgi:predicted amidohydrolase
VLISAEWPLKRVLHWETLLKARAIENQCFFAATNTVGTIGGETFAGSSQVISPWGEVVDGANTQDEQLVTTEIDLSITSHVRNLIPVFKDRRPDVYESDMSDFVEKHPAN